MSETNLNEERITALVNKMPAFPRSVQQVLTITADINCSPKDLVQVVELDPVLTGRILKVVNSAYFGLSRKMTSVKHAVVFVGINTIKHLALSIAAVGSLPKKNKAGLPITHYLKHSLSVGAIARVLALELGLSGREAEDYFLAGLIHDIGKIVLSMHSGPEYREVLERHAKTKEPLWMIENELLGLTHAQVSVMVCEKWQMPEGVSNAIANHHELSTEGDLCKLTACLYTANAFANVIEGQKDHPPLPNVITTLFGYELNHLVAQKSRFITEIKKVGIFLQID